MKIQASGSASQQGGKPVKSANGEPATSARTRHYRNLQVWQKAMLLAREIYAATDSFPKREVFALSSQLRRAAVSVPSNIAEGHGRLSDGAFRLFLSHARGSLYELQTQLELAARLGYLQAESAANLDDISEEVARMLNGLLRVLRKGEPPES